MPLEYSIRIRDLLHGYVYLTEIEKNIINHPLFQRLRHIRHNDVAFYVYPSLNISRFEHSIGTLFVAGKMATNITQSKSWDQYNRSLKDSDFNLTPEQFQQCVRLYALLHDIGHLPLSHAFEQAFEDFAKKEAPQKPLEVFCKEWTGEEGFERLHEAMGAKLATVILNQIGGLDGQVKKVVLILMTNKKLQRGNIVLQPIKELIDSEVDADRADSVARDGLLAGGEYGNYDIERICSSIFVWNLRDKWRLAYHHKSIGTIEALLFERYRTYVWIHFHHRVSALKAAARLVISELLSLKRSLLKCLKDKNMKNFHLYDDVWLWNLIRNWNPTDPPLIAAKKALLLRDKNEVNLLWKNRKEFQTMQDRLTDNAGLRPVEILPKLNRKYENELSNYLGQFARVLHLHFKPLGAQKVFLIDESGKEVGDITTLSTLCRELNGFWNKEVRYYIIIFGEIRDKIHLEKKWLTFTSEYIQE